MTDENDNKLTFVNFVYKDGKVVSDDTIVNDPMEVYVVYKEYQTNPDTGDNIGLYVFGGIMSLLTLLVSSLKLSKVNK